MSAKIGLDPANDRARVNDRACRINSSCTFTTKVEYLNLELEQHWGFIR
jgi:hypothetical protein